MSIHEETQLETQMEVVENQTPSTSWFCGLCQLPLAANTTPCPNFPDQQDKPNAALGHHYRWDVAKWSAERGCAGCDAIWTALNDYVSRHPGSITPDEEYNISDPKHVWLPYIGWGRSRYKIPVMTIRFFLRSLRRGRDGQIPDVPVIDMDMRTKTRKNSSYMMYERADFAFFSHIPRPQPNSTINSGHDVVVTCSETPVQVGLETPYLKRDPNPSLRPDMASLSQSLQHHLQTCQSGHIKTCDPPKPTRLPKRLVQITPSSPNSPDPLHPQVRLIQPSDEMRGEYISLSWCWGGLLPSCITTPQSLPSNLINIDWDSLPPVFQDAVTLVLSLGKSYIWIDALCIVQGPDGDWATEAGKMASIYNDAYLTIMATRAGDPNGRFVAEKSTFPAFRVGGPESEVVEEVGLDGTINNMARTRGNNNINQDDVYFHQVVTEKREWGRISTFGQIEPLAQRGWVLQEYLLSPRIAHCTSLDLVYECSSGRVASCRVFPERWRTSVLHPFHISRSVGARMGTNEWVKKWWWVITSFSETSLSFDGDKLPAISGLAKYFRSLMGSLSSLDPGCYLAGMWEMQLLDNLAWKINVKGSKEEPDSEDEDEDGNVKGVVEGEDILDRPEWRAPTWSWASVNNRISEPRIQPTRPPSQFLALDNFSVIPKGPDPEGQLLSSHLKFTTAILPGGVISYLPINFTQPLPSDTKHRATITFHHDNSNVTFNVQPDYNLHLSTHHRMPSGSSVVLMPIEWQEPDELGILDKVPSLTSCMVLRCVSEPKGEYERVGIAEPADEDWECFWEQCEGKESLHPALEERSICIV